MEESKIHEQIAKVLEAANSDFKSFPNLMELAEKLNLSQEDLELLFNRFAGTQMHLELSAPPLVATRLRS